MDKVVRFCKIDSNEVILQNARGTHLAYMHTKIAVALADEINERYCDAGESGQFDTHGSWRPCPLCKSDITYNKQTTTPEHNAECDTCGYVVSFSVDMNENDARKCWNKLVAN